MDPSAVDTPGEASGSTVQVKEGKKKQKVKVDKEGKRIREGEFSFPKS